jgi:hypothetical protein
VKGIGVDRRTVLTGALAGAAGVTLGGCGLLVGDPPPPHPLLGTLRDIRAVLTRYQTTISAHPTLAERLGPLRDNHRTHLATVAKLIGPTASESPAPPGPVAVPPDEEAAVHELRDLERTGQQTATRACLAARPEYAGLLGAIAAGRASHREVLR